MRTKQACFPSVPMRRRSFLASTIPFRLLQAEVEQPRTFVYKRVGDCEIKADVFGVSRASRKPVAVWLHGGALIMGSRKLPGGSILLESLLASGFAVVAVDYRLAHDPDVEPQWFEPYCPIRKSLARIRRLCWCTARPTPMFRTSSRKIWRSAFGRWEWNISYCRSSGRGTVCPTSVLRRGSQ